MILRNGGNGVDRWAFAGLQALPGVRHGVFTRRGGTSPAPFDSLNVGLGVGDDEGRVAANRERVAAAMGGGVLIRARQVHGTAVHVVTDREDPAGPAQADALVTDIPGRLLMIQVADCQPVLLADPRCRVVAAVHAGWRGSVGNVIGATVGLMRRRFGVRPESLWAAIGPSLGPCCGEFVNYRREIPPDLWRFRVGPVHFDFWAVSRFQLLEAGLDPARIEAAGVCTRCRPETFFSYRREGTTGRFAAVIGLDGKDASRCAGPRGGPTGLAASAQLGEER
mgnify:CR=1 FL=1